MRGGVGNVPGWDGTMGVGGSGKKVESSGDREEE